MYGKINKSGMLEIYHKRYIRIGDRIISNPSPKHMALAGYKPIVMTEPPTPGDGQTIVIDYIDNGECIKSVYTLSGGLK
jgi:hypothetical protein